MWGLRVSAGPTNSYRRSRLMDSRLTSKERMFRALQGEQPDVVPAAPAYPGLFLADFERAFYVEQYRLRMRGRSRYPIDHGEDTRFRVQAKYQSHGIFKTRPDWIEVSRGASRAWADRTDIVLQDGVLCYEDKVSGVRLPMRGAALPPRRRARGRQLRYGRTGDRPWTWCGG